MKTSYQIRSLRVSKMGSYPKIKNSRILCITLTMMLRLSRIVLSIYQCCQYIPTLNSLFTCISTIDFHFSHLLSISISTFLYWYLLDLRSPTENIDVESVGENINTCNKIYCLIGGFHILTSSPQSDLGWTMAFWQMKVLQLLSLETEDI